MTPSIESADDFAILMDMFVAESEESLTALEQSLLVLEEHPDDQELLSTIFRHAHTLKGNSASVGLVELAEVTHTLEDVLDRMRSR